MKILMKVVVSVPNHIKPLLLLVISFQSFLLLAQEAGNSALQVSNEVLQEVDSMLLVAREQIKGGNGKEAILLLNEALELADSTTMETMQASIFLALGNAYRNQGDYNTALSFFENSLQLHRQHADSLGECKALEHINIIYQKQGQYERALDALFSVLEIKKEFGDSRDLAKTYLNIGNAYAKSGSENQAIPYYLKSKKIFQEQGDDYHFAMVLNNLGNVHSAINQSAEAELYYIESIEIKRSLDNQFGLASSLNNLGDFYYRQKDYEKANTFFLQSLEIVTSIKADNLLAKVLQNLAYTTDAQGKHKQAFNYYHRYDKLKAKLTKQQFDDAIAEFQVKFETETKQKQILELEVENAAKAATIQQEKLARARAKNTRNALLMGIAFLLIITVLALVAYRQKQRLNKDLSAKAAEISAQKDLISEQNEELMAVTETKERLFSIVAHNLRGPLASLTGFSDIVNHYLKKGQHDKFKNIIAETDQTVQQLNSLVNNTLVWADALSDKIPYNPERLSLNGVVEQTFITVKAQAQHKDIALSRDIPEDLEVFVDVNFAKTILINLLNNALKFTPEKGHVAVLAETLNDQVQVTVKDSGQGISPERMKELFSEKTNSSTAGTQGERGTGLGLKVTKEFVERGGGKLTVKSTLGEGSQFIFTWPLSEQKIAR